MPNLSRAKLVTCTRSGLKCDVCGKDLEPGELKYSYPYKGGNGKKANRNFHWCCRCNRRRETDIVPLIQSFRSEKRTSP